MKAHGLNCVVVFLLPVGVCMNVNFILAYVMIAVMSSTCQLITHLELFTWKDCH